MFGHIHDCSLMEYFRHTYQDLTQQASDSKNNYVNIFKQARATPKNMNSSLNIFISTFLSDHYVTEKHIKLHSQHTCLLCVFKCGVLIWHVSAQGLAAFCQPEHS